MEKITDFGEKIGGARKDEWIKRGISILDLEEMTEVERSKYAIKQYVWPKPDWEGILSAGVPRVVAYWQNEMRKALKPGPVSSTKEEVERYIKFASYVRDSVMGIKEEHELSTFYKIFFVNKGYVNKSYTYYVDIAEPVKGLLTNRLLNASQVINIQKLKRRDDCAVFMVPENQREYARMKNHLAVYKFDQDNITTTEGGQTQIACKEPNSVRYFYPKGKFSDPSCWVHNTYFIVDMISRQPLAINIERAEDTLVHIEEISQKWQERCNAEANTEPEKQVKHSKTKFKFPHLEWINRNGEDYLSGKHATAEHYLHELKFRAGEFGKWESNAERQKNLDMAYLAFCDLAYILSIRRSDTTYNGLLAIAFGARGRGGADAASAHYELDRRVINLTRITGAGCTAHEWFHGLDDHIGRLYCPKAGKLGSEIVKHNEGNFPKEFVDLIESLRWKFVQIDLETLEKNQLDKINDLKERIIFMFASLCPKSMTAEQYNVWAERIEQLNSIAGHEAEPDFLNRIRAILKEMSVLSKKSCGRILKKSTRLYIEELFAELNKRIHKPIPQERRFKRVATEYYIGSTYFDRCFRKSTHGYWSSIQEMAARAFDCYIDDKLKSAGLISNYLTAYSGSFLVPDDKGTIIYAFPRGEEREQINEKFDALFARLKTDGILGEITEIKDGKCEG